MYKPRLDLAEVKKHLSNQNRQPFRDLLALVFESAPSAEAMQAIAEKNPDRWAQMLAIVARLGGYNEKLEVEGSVIMRATSLSDAELELLIQEKVRQLEAPNGDPK